MIACIESNNRLQSCRSRAAKTHIGIRLPCLVLQICFRRNHPRIMGLFCEKRPTPQIIGLFCRQRLTKIRLPMGLCHTLSVGSSQCSYCTHDICVRACTNTHARVLTYTETHALSVLFLVLSLVLCVSRTVCLSFSLSLSLARSLSLSHYLSLARALSLSVSLSRYPLQPPSSFSYTVSPSHCFTNIHIHIHICIHIRIHIHINTQAFTHAHRGQHKGGHTLSLVHAHTHALSLSLTLARAVSLSLMHTGGGA